MVTVSSLRASDRCCKTGHREPCAWRRGYGRTVCTVVIFGVVKDQVEGHGCGDVTAHVLVNTSCARAGLWSEGWTVLKHGG